MRSGTSEYTIKTNHSVNLDDVAITDNENRYWHRKKKYAMWFRTGRSDMNKETCVQLAHVYDSVLHTTNKVTAANQL